jgi:hypothetical protein
MRRNGTEDREGMRRNDTGKNYLAIRNLYRLTDNSYMERSTPPMTLSCQFCDVSRYGIYVACLAMSIAMVK